MLTSPKACVISALDIPARLTELQYYTLVFAYDPEDWDTSDVYVWKDKFFVDNNKGKIISRREAHYLTERMIHNDS